MSAIAAVDADKDTDVFTFKSKKYTYSNVDILAVLQAAPYFGELQDNYYNGNIGETLYGKLSGKGTVTSKTKMASIGAYASFPSVLQHCSSIRRRPIPMTGSGHTRMSFPMSIRSVLKMMVRRIR